MQTVQNIHRYLFTVTLYMERGRERERKRDTKIHTLATYSLM